MSRALPRTPLARVALWAVLAVVALNLVVAVAAAVAPGPSGRPSSSLATTPEGFAAWAELARRTGRDVVPERARLDAAELPPGATVVALDAPGLRREEALALRRHLDRGGRVLAGGEDPASWLGVLAPGIRWARGGPAAAPVTGVPGVRTVRTAGEGRWAGDGLLLRRRGGRLLLLADASPLQNRLLAQEDNAVLALALGGRGPLVFAEAAHGYGRATGLAALPERAKWALVLLGLAALALMAARGRRFGPPEPERRELPPPRVAYVDALAATLARTGRPDAAMAPVRGAALSRLGVDGGDPAVIRAAALEAGLDPDAAGALASPPARGHDGAVAIARAHAELSATGGGRR